MSVFVSRKSLIVYYVSTIATTSAKPIPIRNGREIVNSDTKFISTIRAYLQVWYLQMTGIGPSPAPHLLGCEGELRTTGRPAEISLETNRPLSRTTDSAFNYTIKDSVGSIHLRTITVSNNGQTRLKHTHHRQYPIPCDGIL